jgi:hypothetical protein
MVPTGGPSAAISIALPFGDGYTSWSRHASRAADGAMRTVRSTSPICWRVRVSSTASVPRMNSGSGTCMKRLWSFSATRLMRSETVPWT